jgi:NAD(P)H-dependent FMN reductase
MLKVAIILGSTRTGRKGEEAGKWAYDFGRKRSDADFELLDIELPLLDEPMTATPGQYMAREHA